MSDFEKIAASITAGLPADESARATMLLEWASNEAREKLRDSFAMAAMAAIIGQAKHKAPPPGETFVDGVAHDAYLFADAMLKAREAK